MMTDGSNINNNLTIVIPETENHQNGKKSENLSIELKVQKKKF